MAAWRIDDKQHLALDCLEWSIMMPALLWTAQYAAYAAAVAQWMQQSQLHHSH